MHPLAQYVLTLSCAALIGAVILSIGGTDGPGGALRRMICGTFLAFVAISPLHELDFGALNRDYEQFSQAAQAAAMDGKRQAGKTLDADISRRCEAYILDKAGTLPVSVEVRVDPETHLPRSVSVYGEIPEKDRDRLAEQITRGLGIERSGQQWIPNE